VPLNAILTPTVPVFVSALMVSSVLSPKTRLPVSEGASLYLPNTENRSLNLWSMRMLPASNVAVFEYTPVNCAVYPSDETRPLGTG
jgi:hypothetical protein